MGKAITTILGIVLLVIVGFLIFDNGDGNIVRQDENAAENLTGTGGPDDDSFDPLEGVSEDDLLEATGGSGGSGDENDPAYQDKG